MSQVGHFDAVAARYEALRNPGPLSRYERLDESGAFAGTRLLDVGCGTGAHLRVFQDHFGCRISGVDTSSAMLAEARAKLPDVDLRLARAEELPFAEGAFDRAVMMLVVHHLDRPRAFVEAHRVLTRGGRLLIQTPEPAMFPRAWLAPLFPSYVRVEQARFPTREALEGELRAAGFTAASTTSYAVDRSFARAEAIERIRGRYASTFDHFSDEEYREGLARAERDLPDPVEYTVEMLVVRADR
ncbi:MAG: class I SAM-dependent methyltransferase [Gaiellaceae bacterium]